MTGGYAIMTFRLAGHGGRSDKTFYDLYGKGNANKRMAGGGMQKHAMPSSMNRQNYLFSHIARNTSKKK